MLGLNNNITNGFNNVQSTLCQGFSGVNQAINTNGYETRLGMNDIGYRLQDCCCDIKGKIADYGCQTQRAIDGVNYNMATNFGALTNSLDKGLCALSHQVDNKIDMAQMENRAGFQSIRDMFTNDKIANLQRELELSQFQNSQQSQTQALKDYVASYFGCPPGVINCNQQ